MYYYVLGIVVRPMSKSKLIRCPSDPSGEYVDTRVSATNMFGESTCRISATIPIGTLNLAEETIKECQS